MPRLGLQFHWTNSGYRDFDHMLSTLKRKRRKEVRRERRKAQSHGLDLVVKEGAELTERDWEALYVFYRRTVASHGAIPYLTKAFFAALRGPLMSQVVCSLAYCEGEAVAGTLNFRQGSHLYGRYWGSLGAYDCLHFELCYYALISWCIDRGLTRFEAGAQGSHEDSCQR
jgi:predicted N-acyltransferase